MAYPIDKKLVIAVASSALFDLSESDEVFKIHGLKKYKEFQKKNLDLPLKHGVAFPFVKRFLNINNSFPDQKPVEVVLISRNSAVTGRRVFRTIKSYQLDISRAAFLEGDIPYPYIPAFNASLFLSANEDDVIQANQYNYPAGTVLNSQIVDDEKDSELRIAFDFDGVIADDSAEMIYRTSDLDGFHAHETLQSEVPLNAGPLADLFKKLSHLQRLEDEKVEKDEHYKRIINISIITARNAPSHERVITTLENWGVTANKTFFLGGMEKNRILQILRPQMFFDDQKLHLQTPDCNIPMVHIPFGVANTT